MTVVNMAEIRGDYLVTMAIYGEEELLMSRKRNLSEAIDEVLDLHNLTRTSEATRFTIYKRDRFMEPRKMMELIGTEKGLCEVGVPA